MSNFWNVYKLSSTRLLKNWYMLFFYALTIIPILIAIFLAVYPNYLVSLNPNHPANQQKNNEQTVLQTPTLEEIQQQEEREKTEELFYGPRYIRRSWADVFVGLVFYFLVGSSALLAMASLGSRVIAGEAETGTLQLLFLRPIGRCTIYLAKYCGLVTTGLLLTIPSSVIIYAIAYGSNFELGGFLASLAILFIAMMAYSALFLFLSIFREGLYIALAYTIFWEIFVGFITERARTFAMSYYIRSLYYTFFLDPSKFPEYDVLSTVQACSTLVIVSIVFVSIGIAFFRKQEFHFC